MKFRPIIRFMVPIIIAWLVTSCNKSPKQLGNTAFIDPVDMVYPLLDTDNSRWFLFSSACRPFGMVNLSPDTQTGGAWGSGYRYKTDTIKGFSHIHAWQMSGLSVMPVTVNPGAESLIFGDFYSFFDHKKERVSPGFHQLILDRYNIKVELTSTARVGFHKYRFPLREKSGILFNLNGVLGPCTNRNGTLSMTDKQTLVGKLTNAPTRRRPKPLDVFFRLEFNTAIEQLIRDPKTGNYLALFEENAEEVLMKAALSYTSIENASLNMQTEMPDWDFQSIVAASRLEWNDVLGRIKIEGGTYNHRRRFYTDLWHALQGRRKISDVNGAYPDNTGSHFRIGHIPLDKNGIPRFNHYNSDSFWGAQWTINTLWGLVYPEIMEDFVHSLMQYYQDGGLVPRGPSGGNYTYVMSGASSTPFIVSAIQKGIVGNGLDEIYTALRKNHMPGGIMEKIGYEHTTNKGGGLSYYLREGYVPYPLLDGHFGLHQDGVSLTLEYAYQDWTLAQLAKKLGKEEDYRYFMQRSTNYKNVFNPISGWMHPKDKNQKWDVTYDPYQYEHGFMESNGAQSSWFVPHDIVGLAELMGGKEVAVQKLNEQFEAARKLGFTSGNSHDKEAHPEYKRIPINYGNQPSIQTAHIFQHLGRPDLTDYWVSEVVNTAFTGLTPSLGYNGDEDQGLMGSLAVLMKIGLFQMNGGTEENPKYQISKPQFNKITIYLNNEYYTGTTFEILKRDTGHGSERAVEMVLNNHRILDFSLMHNDITKGGRLELNYSDHP